MQGSSYAGLTRVSINFHDKHFSKKMDCRVKPGNDGCALRRSRASQFCSRTPSITTVEAELLPARLESRMSRRSVPLIQRLRVIL